MTIPSYVDTLDEAPEEIAEVLAATIGLTLPDLERLAAAREADHA